MMTIKKTLPDQDPGPHQLGDPNDTSLRRVERDVLIPKIMREKAKKEKCIPETKEFEQCCKKAGVLMTFKCKMETKKMYDCYEKWYKNKDFVDECTQIYLERRRQYRESGKGEKLKKMH